MGGEGRGRSKRGDETVTAELKCIRDLVVQRNHRMPTAGAVDPTRMEAAERATSFYNRESRNVGDFPRRLHGALGDVIRRIVRVCRV